MLKVIYTGSSKILKRICEAINRKAELGETAENAYRGDRGKAAYDHSQLTSGNPHNVTAADLGLGDVAQRVNAIMFAIGMVKAWSTHKHEVITDHDQVPIVFHGADASNYNYLLWH